MIAAVSSSLAPVLLGQADLLGGLVAQGLLFLYLGHQGAALFVFLEKFVQRDVLIARLQCVDQFLGILPNAFDVQHGLISSCFG